MTREPCPHNSCKVFRPHSPKTQSQAPCTSSVHLTPTEKWWPRLSSLPDSPVRFGIKLCFNYQKEMEMGLVQTPTEIFTSHLNLSCRQAVPCKGHRAELGLAGPVSLLCTFPGTLTPSQKQAFRQHFLLAVVLNSAAEPGVGGTTTLPGGSTSPIRRQYGFGG